MSETFDTELSETEAAIGVLTDAVNHAADKFTDLARKLQAAIDALSQQGITAQQLSRFNDIQSHLSAEASALTAAANAADPDSDTTTAPAGGDDTIAGGGGNDTISPNPAPVVITTTSLPDASTQGAYSFQIEAEGGTGPYTFSSSPDVDNGLQVASSGLVSGNATAEADSTFVVTAVDSLGSPSAPVTLTLHTSADIPE